MDTLLMNGDHGLDTRGYPHLISGAEELLQRALLRLGIRRGSFVYDPELGSELHRLPRSDSDALRRAAHSLVAEALLPIPELRVESVECAFPGTDELSIAVRIACAEQSWLIGLTV